MKTRAIDAGAALQRVVKAILDAAHAPRYELAHTTQRVAGACTPAPTDHQISISEARMYLQKADEALRRFGEGPRAEHATVPHLGAARDAKKIAEKKRLIVECVGNREVRTKDLWREVKTRGWPDGSEGAFRNFLRQARDGLGLELVLGGKGDRESFYRMKRR